mmetsp:Transcript_9079/g.22280  ORF Transcript_9079/g.22280 Transcript_9079/m.22280 type:complete len:203 (+) Transcript_9079:1057-1665(+)
MARTVSMLSRIRRFWRSRSFPLLLCFESGSPDPFGSSLKRDSAVFMLWISSTGLPFAASSNSLSSTLRAAAGGKTWMIFWSSPHANIAPWHSFGVHCCSSPTRTSFTIEPRWFIAGRIAVVSPSIFVPAAVSSRMSATPAWADLRMRGLRSVAKSSRARKRWAWLLIFWAALFDCAHCFGCRLARSIFPHSIPHRHATGSSL